jgi:NitT/TauT family transport system substrate-binding protein
MKRPEFLQLALAGGAAALMGADGPKLEKPSLTIGTAVESPTQLPLYVAIARTFKEQGLDVKVLGFRGDAESAQALAGGSIDINLASSTGLINLIGAGQPIIGFYAGFNQADFSWLAQPSIKSWRDLKGESIGVSTFGSLTDLITRYALRKNGLEPERDVQMIQAGGSPSAVQALRAGRLAAAILNGTPKWQAQDQGFTVLGTQAKDVAPNWPKHLFMTKTAFIDQNPNTMLALLRAHVSALRFARANRGEAVKILADRLKYEDAYAQRAYDEAMPDFDERGHLPDKSMPVFWKLSIANGDVTAPWPDAKLLDPRFVNSFTKWAPH